MAHCAHILAPSSAWTTDPNLNRSLSASRRQSRLGDAIRALKPRAKKAATEEGSQSLNELAERDRQKRPWSDETLSTAPSDDECSVASDEYSVASDEQHLVEKVVNFSLPGSVEELPDPSSTSSEGLSSASAVCDDEDHCDLEVASIACNHDINQQTSLDDESRKYQALCRKTELRQMAHLISQRAASKYSGRVYQDVRSAFLAVDADANGKISPLEAKAFCKHFNLTPETSKHFFSLLDPHGTGMADWSSFLARFAPVFFENTDWRLNPGSNLWRRQARAEQTSPAQPGSPKSLKTLG